MLPERVTVYDVSNYSIFGGDFDRKVIVLDFRALTPSPAKVTPAEDVVVGRRTL